MLREERARGLWYRVDVSRGSGVCGSVDLPVRRGVWSLCVHDWEHQECVSGVCSVYL